MDKKQKQVSREKNLWWRQLHIAQRKRSTKDYFNSPFLRYFKRKVDRETLAPERGYGKYTSNMADDEWLQVHAHKDELQRWLKARSLKTTGQKQELIDRVIKAKEDGTETIEEREMR